MRKKKGRGRIGSQAGRLKRVRGVSRPRHGANKGGGAGLWSNMRGCPHGLECRIPGKWGRCLCLVEDHVKAGDYDKALAQCDEILEKIGDHRWLVLNWRGTVHVKAGRFEEALADFNKSIKLYPDHCGGYYARGGLMFEMNRFEEALADFDRAIELNPTKESPWVGRAMCLKALGRLDEACEAFLEALLRLTSDKSRWLVGREGGALLCQRGRYLEAFMMLDQALRLRPDDADALLWHAEALFRLGNPLGAKNEVDRYLQLVPDSEKRDNQRLTSLVKGIVEVLIFEYKGKFLGRLSGDVD